MEKLELTIDPGYANWGLWEAMRELIQNYLDAKDKTDRCGLHYDPRSKCLKMTNYGVTMNRRALLLGSTTKRDDSEARGQWGEGMKIAWATLRRLRHRVEVITGTEIWSPDIVESEAFDGAKLLSIMVQKLAFPEDKVSVEVTRLSAADWEMISSRVLHLTEIQSGEVLEGEGGRLLTTDRFRGKLFVKGLYVCDLPGAWKWGYDLDNVELDRDRKVPSAISMEPLICSLLKDMMARGEIAEETILNILGDEEKQEGGLFAEWWNDREGGGEFHKRVAAKFRDKHGDTAVPVSSNEESLDATNHGMKAVVVPRAVRAVVERSEGSLNHRIAAQPPEMMSRPTEGAFSTVETKNMFAAINLVKVMAPWVTFMDVLVVTFTNPNELGEYRNGKIRIARRLLGQFGMLVVVIAHAAACRDAQEGTREHRFAKDKIIAAALEVI